MPFNLTTDYLNPTCSVLRQTFSTSLFWQHEKQFFIRQELPPEQQWNDQKQSHFIEKLIRRQPVLSLILREIESPYSEIGENRLDTPLAKTHTIFEVFDGQQALKAIQNFHRNDERFSLYLPKSLCDIPAFKQRKYPIQGMRFQDNFRNADTIAYNDFTMMDVDIITGVPDPNDSRHNELAKAEFQKLITTRGGLYDAY